MEHNEQEIWQRVFSQEPPRRQDIRPLLLDAMESAAAFRALANSLTGPAREQARQLHRSQLETLHCLRGLEILSGGGNPMPKQPPAPKEPMGKQLERAFFRARRAMGEYTARSLDGEFGMVFRRLAQQEETRCTQIAQLLGVGNADG